MTSAAISSSSDMFVDRCLFKLKWVCIYCSVERLLSYELTWLFDVFLSVQESVCVQQVSECAVAVVWGAGKEKGRSKIFEAAEQCFMAYVTDIFVNE